MKRGYLSDFFQGVGAKFLAQVDTISEVSNQHEVTGSDPLRRILGETARKQADRFDATYIWISGEQESLTEYGKLSWYDSRKNDPTRGAEWRLYYQTNAVTRTMQPNNTLVVARQKDDRLLFIVVPQGSTIESQIFWLFGLHAQITLEFEPQIITRENAAALDFTAQFILDELGIQLEDPDANSLDAIIERFGMKFPSTRDFSDLARLTLPEVDARDDPDAALLAWLDHEEAMFRRLERRVVSERLSAGFATEDDIDVDGFLQYSLQVQNRRKSRMGRSFEHHLEAVFRAFELQFEAQGKTEQGNTADFLFPSAAAYIDPTFPDDQLAMLAAKSTCKDRWRQVLPEARRIWPKHLVTLEPAISSAQTEQMIAENLKLVVPAGIQTSYRPSQQSTIMTVQNFIDFVQSRGSLSR